MSLSFSSGSIASTLRLLRERRASPVEIVEEMLQRIEALDPKIQAWARVDREGARQRAIDLEAQFDRASGLPLFGIPYGAKDIIDTAGLETECGSRVRAGFVPQKDAWIVGRLRDAGAVLLGKTTTTEFANLGTTPPTVNPWKDGHTPGGSSSGSAAALAARMAMFTLGTQTAGSLSRPAGYNGLTVLKGTYGSVGRTGVVPASWSLDHVGAMTTSVEDAAIVFNVIAGRDEDDLDHPTTKATPARIEIGSLRSGTTVGLLRHSHFDGTGDDVLRGVDEARKVFEGLGVRIVDVVPPEGFEDAFHAHGIVMQAEVSTYHRETFERTQDLFGEYLRDFIAEGLTISAVAYVEAQRRRLAYARSFADAFVDCDVLLTPTSPTTAPEGTHATGSPVFNAPFTNIGVPTLAMPSGLSADGLPTSIQMIAPRHAEQRLVDIGSAFQSATDWHLMVPPIVVAMATLRPGEFLPNAMAG